MIHYIHYNILFISNLNGTNMTNFNNLGNIFIAPHYNNTNNLERFTEGKDNHIDEPYLIFLKTMRRYAAKDNMDFMIENCNSDVISNYINRTISFLDEYTNKDFQRVKKIALSKNKPAPEKNRVNKKGTIIPRI